jgi:allophanate hydrolase subunit 1
MSGHSHPATLELARRTLAQMGGVMVAEANHVTKTLLVEYDDERVTFAEILQKLKKVEVRASHGSREKGPRARRERRFP